MSDDEFDDDIDWGTVTLPHMPLAVTPSNKRQRLNLNEASSSSSLLEDLEVSPTFGGGLLKGASGDEDKGGDEDGKEEVGDKMQLRAIELANRGENVFLTGKAGTGKSWATKKIVEDFNDNDRVIHVTAPTGIAAINVGGTTIHSWGRFQLGQYYEDFDSMMSKHTMKKICNMDALLIDEISMLDGHLFDVLECMISIIRYYDDTEEKVSEKVSSIKQTAGSKTVMSDAMLGLRWDSVSKDGLGNIPPFGGLQLISVGDFYQLPPVPARFDVLMENENLTQSGYDLKIGRQGSYAFESHAWHHSNFKTIELTEIHRQEEKDGLFEFLNAMREGETCLETKHGTVLKALQTPLPERSDGIIPTELHSKNYVVDRVNKDELLNLAGGIHDFVSLDEVNLSDEYLLNILNSNGLQNLYRPGINTVELIESRSLPRHIADILRRDLEVLKDYAQEHFFEKECRVTHDIELKEDAQVMLLWNLDFKAQLANGSRGVVRGFFPAQGYYTLIQAEVKKREEERENDDDDDDDGLEEPYDIFENMGKPGGKNVGSDLPVITPRKRSNDTENGISGKKAEEKVFDFSGVNPDFVKEIKFHIANMGPVALEREFEEMKKVVCCGVVELPYIHFANGKRRIIRPQPFTKEFKGVGTATRWQIPMTLAWAISIHKSQGMTIECLYVNLTDCFAIGQAYVACSRGKNVKSTTVKNFEPSEIKTSKKVKLFYNSVHCGKPYTGPRWSETIEAFDEDAKKDVEQKKIMKQHYNNAVPCSKCDTMCVVRQIKSNRNHNQGKYFISCPASDGEHGHTWELLNTLVLKSNEPTGGDQSSSFAFMRPGVDEAIAGRLDGKRVVTTGVFPELGGGFGLKLGKDKMKEMIESFGGKVTGSISGKTNFVIAGDEPDKKRLEDARSKGLPIISRSILRNILIGEEDVPGEDGSQPSMKNFLKTEAYDV